jgi:hypothetical protein
LGSLGRLIRFDKRGTDTSEARSTYRTSKPGCTTCWPWWTPLAPSRRSSLDTRSAPSHRRRTGTWPTCGPPSSTRRPAAPRTARAPRARVVVGAQPGLHRCRRARARRAVPDAPPPIKIDIGRTPAPPDSSQPQRTRQSPLYWQRRQWRDVKSSGERDRCAGDNSVPATTGSARMQPTGAWPSEARRPWGSTSNRSIVNLVVRASPHGRGQGDCALFRLSTTDRDLHCGSTGA